MSEREHEKEKLELESRLQACLRGQLEMKQENESLRQHARNLEHQLEIIRATVRIMWTLNED